MFFVFFGVLALETLKAQDFEYMISELSGLKAQDFEYMIKWIKW